MLDKSKLIKTLFYNYYYVTFSGIVSRLLHLQNQTNDLHDFFRANLKGVPITNMIYSRFDWVSFKHFNTCPRTFGTYLVHRYRVLLHGSILTNPSRWISLFYLFKLLQNVVCRIRQVDSQEICSVNETDPSIDGFDKMEARKRTHKHFVESF